MPFLKKNHIKFETRHDGFLYSKDKKEEYPFIIVKHDDSAKRAVDFIRNELELKQINLIIRFTLKKMAFFCFTVNKNKKTKNMSNYFGYINMLRLVYSMKKVTCKM